MLCLLAQGRALPGLYLLHWDVDICDVHRLPWLNRFRNVRHLLWWHRTYAKNGGVSGSEQSCCMRCVSWVFDLGLLPDLFLSTLQVVDVLDLKRLLLRLVRWTIIGVTLAEMVLGARIWLVLHYGFLLLIIINFLMPFASLSVIFAPDRADLRLHFLWTIWNFAL